MFMLRGFVNAVLQAMATATAFTFASNTWSKVNLGWSASNSDSVVSGSDLVVQYSGTYTVTTSETRNGVHSTNQSGMYVNGVQTGTLSGTNAATSTTSNVVTFSGGELVSIYVFANTVGSAAKQVNSASITLTPV